MTRLLLTGLLLALHLGAQPGTDAQAPAGPRLSWLLPAGPRGRRQTAYQILVASSAENLDKNRGDQSTRSSRLNDRTN